MDLDRYKSDDLQSVRKQLDNINGSIITLLRIKSVAISSLWVAAFIHNDPFIMTLPLFISVSIFFIANGYRKNICRNSAYIIVFYGREISPEWETRLHTYYNEYHSSSISKRVTYVLELIVSDVIFLYINREYLISSSVPFDLKMSIYIAIIAVAYILVGIYIQFKKVDYEKERGDCIKRWENIKTKEKSKIKKKLLSKFKNDDDIKLIKELINKNLNANNSSLELLNSSLQLSMKNIVLTRLLELNPDYKNIKDEEELKALLDIWKKL